MTSGQLLKEAGCYEKKLITDRRFLHAHPGTGFDLSETTAYVKAELEAIGLKPRECGKAGLTVNIGGKKSGKVFLIRGDMAAGHPDKGYCYPQHHPKVRFDEEVLVPESTVYAYAAVRWLEEHK